MNDPIKSSHDPAALPTSVALSAAVALALTACGSKDPPAPSASSATASAAVTVSAAPSAAAPAPAATGAAPTRQRTLEVGAPPPPAERLFSAALTEGGTPTVLGAHGDTLWAGDIDGDTIRVRWISRGEGSPLVVATGATNGPYALWVGRGRSLSQRDAPVSVERIDPATGKAEVIWRTQTERSEAAAIDVVDANGDGKHDLAFAYYATNHLVKTRDWITGSEVQDGDGQHMASTRLFADVDGDGRADEIVGQVYDADPEKAGTLRVKIGETWHTVPTEGGIRTAITMVEDGRAVIYVSDGWAKNYGRDARARLKRARWDGKAFAVTLLGSSTDDYSFFDLSAVRTPSGTAILARGNATTQLAHPGAPSEPLEAIAAAAKAKATVLLPGAEGEVLVVHGRAPERVVRVTVKPGSPTP